jgi:TetR/AcrR family transcriptional regulator, lmrAB and yxaGH operons repressor
MGDTRERMVASAAALLGQRGTSGTTVDAVLTHSGAPRGSVYHHFPGGRDEIVTDAVRFAAGQIALFIDPDLEPREALRRFAAFWKNNLEATDFRAGCPVLALTVGDADTIDGADELLRDVFALWHDRFVTMLTVHGFPKRRAERMATLAIAAVEGAVALCRVERSVAPLDDVVAELSQLLVV